MVQDPPFKAPSLNQMASSTSQSQQLPPVTLPQPLYPRPLRREGAQYFSSAAEEAIEAAMMRSSSPLEESPLGKRAREESESLDHDDPEPDEELPSSQHQQIQPSLSNVIASTLRYASRKKLRPEQRDEVEAFLSDAALGRQAKLFVSILSIENKIDAFRSATPPYQLSEELKTNIHNYGIAVMLSVNISAYKGDIPRNHVLNILKRYRFDLPVGIEHDYANWEKISTYVGYSLTQSRSRVKKLIKESIKENTNVFTLAQTIVHSTPCRPTIQLCARVALMRAIFIECSGGEKYWNLIDARLEFIRSKAGSSVSKLARAFNDILKADRSKFGADEDYVITDTIPDEWQQRVDNAVAGTPEDTAGA